MYSLLKSIITKVKGIDTKLDKALSSLLSYSDAREDFMYASYPYTNADGSIAYYKHEFREEGKKPDFRTWSYRNGQWVKNIKTCPRPLYQRHLFRNSNCILLVEGEWNVDVLIRHGFTATTHPFGLFKLVGHMEYASQIERKEVLIVLGSSKNEKELGQDLMDFFDSEDISADLVEIPNLLLEGGFESWFQQVGSKEKLLQAINDQIGLRGLTMDFLGEVHEVDGG